MVARGDANDVVDLRVEALHEAAAGPAGAQHDHPGLVVGPGGPEARIAIRGGGGGEARDMSEAARVSGRKPGEVSEAGHGE